MYRSYNSSCKLKRERTGLRCCVVGWHGVHEWSVGWVVRVGNCAWVCVLGLSITVTVCCPVDLFAMMASWKTHLDLQSPIHPHWPTLCMTCHLAHTHAHPRNNCAFMTWSSCVRRVKFIFLCLLLDWLVHMTVFQLPLQCIQNTFITRYHHIFMLVLAFSFEFSRFPHIHIIDITSQVTHGTWQS